MKLLWRQYRVALLFAAVTVGSFLVLHPLLDQYYRHVFEPDAQPTVEFTLALASGEFFFGRPKPYHYPPYFDAQYFIYGVGLWATRALVAVGAIDPDSLANDVGVAVFAIRHTNLLAHCLSTAIAFLLFLHLTRQVLVSIVLAGFVLFSPHLIGIDLLRVDHIVFVLFLSSLYLTVVVSQHSASGRNFVHVLYGMVLAALVLTKITSALFLLLPMFAYGERWRARSFSAVEFLSFLLAFASFALLLMARFIAYELNEPGFTLRIAIEKVQEVSKWSAVMQKTPLFFYNIDQFESYGLLFLSVAVLSLTWIVPRAFTGKGSFEDRLLLLTLLLLSFFGAISFKYARGLYVLVPLYLAVIAQGFPRAIRAGLSAFRLGHPAVNAHLAVVVLMVALIWPFLHYLEAVKRAEMQTVAVQTVKLDPAEWLESNLPKGSKITIVTHSEWAGPPISSNDFKVAYRFLDFPYLEADKMGAFRPPPVTSLVGVTDAIVLNSFHDSFLRQTFASNGQIERKLEWEMFFDELRATYETKRFKALQPAYHVEWVEVIFVRSPRQ